MIGDWFDTSFELEWVYFRVICAGWFRRALRMCFLFLVFGMLLVLLGFIRNKVDLFDIKSDTEYSFDHSKLVGWMIDWFGYRIHWQCRCLWQYYVVKLSATTCHHYVQCCECDCDCGLSTDRSVINIPCAIRNMAIFGSPSAICGTNKMPP